MYCEHKALEKSDVFEAMKEKYDVDLYIINYGTGFSIRTNRDSIDVGALVKPFGGGSHPGAGGVTINDRLLLALLESTTGSIVHID